MKERHVTVCKDPFAPFTRLSKAPDASRYFLNVSFWDSDMLAAPVGRSVTRKSRLPELKVVWSNWMFKQVRKRTPVLLFNNAFGMQDKANN